MDNLERLWLLSAELEGALLIMKKKGVELTAANSKFFVDKIAEMQCLLTAEESVTEEPADEEPVTEQPVTEEYVQEEFVTPEEIVEELVQEEPATESADSEPEVEEPAQEEPAQEESVEESEAEEIADNAIFEEQEDADLPQEPAEESVEESVVEPAAELAEEPAEEAVVETVVEEVVEPAVEEEIVTEPAPAPASAPVPEPTPAPAPEPIRLEDRLARHTSHDITKAFTLNDKFRFRRFLFGNNSSQYNEALDLISQMDSYDETADYFFDQYGWNPEDENVKAFMDIVKKHFES